LVDFPEPQVTHNEQKDHLIEFLVWCPFERKNIILCFIET